MECQICFDTVQTVDTMVLCSKAHRFCAECSWRCCESALGEGLVPACPNEKAEKCGIVSRQVAVAALSRWLSDPVEASHRKAALSSWEIRGNASRGFSSGKLDETYSSAERARQGAVQCIGKGCKAWYVPHVPHTSAPQRLQCTIATCGASFCSSCRRPFHFRSTCAEALRLSARWIKFLQEELLPFLILAARADAERWGPVLKALATSKGALDEAARDALRTFDELRQMEIWKERHCKRCPFCRAVVEKLDGCDMMVCGSDAHGGNQQRGCGKPFIWCDGQPNSALPYEADLRGTADYAAEKDGHASGGADGDEDGSMRERRLRRDAAEEHQASPGVPVRCDGCASPIVGPRLQCVHCESGVDLCVACVGKAAGKQFKLKDGRHHPKNHVFRRMRQGVLMLSARTVPPVSADGVVELRAGSVDLRPGLSTARAAAARAAEARAVGTRNAAELQATAAKPSQGQEQGSRKRAAYSVVGSCGGIGGAGPAARVPRCVRESIGSAPIELSSDDEAAEEATKGGAGSSHAQHKAGPNTTLTTGTIVIDLDLD